MAEFLTTSMTIARIEQLINDARGLIVCITPYVQISETLAQRMIDASKRGVSMTFVYGKGDLNSNEYDTLQTIPRLKLSYFENLHAKCYYNEDTLIITSMNLYEYSAKNREMGILLDRVKDKDLYDKAIKEASSIINHSQPVSLGSPANGGISNNQKNSSSPYYSKQTETTTYTKASKTPSISTTTACCIRCGTHIKLDGTRPYCGKCYDTWCGFANPFYEENYCHGCGNQHATSMEKPFCYSCYKRYHN